MGIKRIVISIIIACLFSTVIFANSTDIQQEIGANFSGQSFAGNLTDSDLESIVGEVVSHDIIDNGTSAETYLEIIRLLQEKLKEAQEAHNQALMDELEEIINKLFG